MQIDQVVALYIALFGRMPEKDGLENWYITALHEGWSEAQLAQSMMQAAVEIVHQNPSYSTIYPQYQSIDTPQNIRDIITFIYQNIFQKSYEDDPDGIDGWTNAVVKGQIELGSVAASIIDVALRYDWSDDPQAYKAYLTFVNRIDGGLYSANHLEKFNGNFSMFQNLAHIVSDTSESLESLKTVINNILLEDYSCQIESIIDESLLKAEKDILSLVNGTRWVNHQVTYSFPSSMPIEYIVEENYNSWEPFDTQEKQQTEEIFKKINTFTNLIPIKATDEDGDIRLNKIAMSDPSIAGYAYFPQNCNNKTDGDIFIGVDIIKEEENITLLHEIGHALGLKHPFDGYHTLSSEYDNTLYTVMSYTNYKAYVLNYNEQHNDIFISFNPQAFPKGYQLFDIKALQYLYGENLIATSNDNIYDLHNLYKEHTYLTLWDSGGIDTIDVSQVENGCYISLEGGTFSSIDMHTIEMQKKELIKNFTQQGYSLDHARQISENIFTLIDNNEIYTGENNLAIAYDTVIENVSTGSGNDYIFDNNSLNHIYTNDGDDTIFIRYGNGDIIDGGAGSDTIYINGYSHEYEYEIDKEADVIYIKKDADVVLIGYNIENIVFDDQQIII